MDYAQKILEKSAQKNMIHWSQKEFSKTHPTLHKTIIEAIKEASNIDSIDNQKKQFLELLKYAMPTNYKDIALERIVERFISESK